MSESSSAAEKEAARQAKIMVDFLRAHSPRELRDLHTKAGSGEMLFIRPADDSKVGGSTAAVPMTPITVHTSQALDDFDSKLTEPRRKALDTAERSLLSRNNETIPRSVDVLDPQTNFHFATLHLDRGPDNTNVLTVIDHDPGVASLMAATRSFAASFVRGNSSASFPASDPLTKKEIDVNLRWFEEEGQPQIVEELKAKQAAFLARSRASSSRRTGRRTLVPPGVPPPTS